MKSDTLALWLRLCEKRSSGAALSTKELEQLEKAEAALNRDERAFDEAAERAAERAAEGRIVKRKERVA